MKFNEHVVQTLAECEDGNVQLCSCGTAHVRFGGATLHIDRYALARLHDLLAASMEQLAVRDVLEAQRGITLLQPTADC